MEVGPTFAGPWPAPASLDLPFTATPIAEVGYIQRRLQGAVMARLADLLRAPCLTVCRATQNAVQLGRLGNCTCCNILPRSGLLSRCDGCHANQTSQLGSGTGSCGLTAEVHGDIVGGFHFVSFEGFQASEVMPGRVSNPERGGNKASNHSNVGRAAFYHWICSNNQECNLEGEPPPTSPASSPLIPAHGTNDNRHRLELRLSRAKDSLENFSEASP